MDGMVQKINGTFSPTSPTRVLRNSVVVFFPYVSAGWVDLDGKLVGSAGVLIDFLRIGVFARRVWERHKKRFVCLLYFDGEKRLKN